jgi:hypothetical protein
MFWKQDCPLANGAERRSGRKPGARVLIRDVPDPDTGIRYPVKFRHPALSGINLPDIYRIVL